MKYRRLGKTGLSVSAVGVGTWQFSGEWGRQYSQSDVDAILDKGAECGINLIDTAECYGDHHAESLIGGYLSRHERGRWVIATKFGHHFHGFMNRSWHLAPGEVEQQLEASLRALHVETIDLYQFHSGSDADFQQPELWSMLERQKRAGKIRHLGISISSKAGTLQAREAPVVGAEVLQVVYSRLERRAERDFLPYARQYDLGVLARVPLASGFLTGKYTTAAQFPSDDMRSTLDPAKVQQWLGEVAQIQQREVPPGIPLAQWALAWCLSNPSVTSVIPGCKDPNQVERNAAATELIETQPPQPP